MSVLVDTKISSLVQSSRLIVEYEGTSLEAASYDMRLGPQYVKNGSIWTLSVEQPTLILQPGEFAILRSLEELNMPLNLIGHNGIMSPWAKRGLVSLFSPQIDPGFCGFLIVPVFNAGDSPISMGYKQKLFTVEFVETQENASYGWSERHGRQDRLDVPVTPSQIRPNLADIADLQKDMIGIKNKLTQVEFQQVSNSSELRNINTMLNMMRDLYTIRLSKREIMVSILALVFGIIIGVASSDSMLDKISRIFTPSHPSGAQGSYQ